MQLLTRSANWCEMHKYIFIIYWVSVTVQLSNDAGIMTFNALNASSCKQYERNMTVHFYLYSFWKILSPSILIRIPFHRYVYVYKV